MSLPAADVTFIRKVFTHLQSPRRKIHIPGTNRAANALILRFSGEDGSAAARLFSIGDKVNLPVSELISQLERNSSVKKASSSLNVLLIHRKDRASDKWSGQIVFPGGKYDADYDADTKATVVRETFESLGFPLEAPDFLYLGQLPDELVPSRDAKKRPLIMSNYVYLHIGDLTPGTKLAKHEVLCLYWLPIFLLERRNVFRRTVKHPLKRYVNFDSPDFIQTVYMWGPRSNVLFPSIRLLEAGNTHIWGLSITCVSALLHAAGRPRLDWPLFASDSPYIQFVFVNTYHAYKELFHGRRPIHLNHQLSLFFLAFLIYTFFYVLLAILIVIWQAMILSLGYVKLEASSGRFGEKSEKPLPFYMGNIFVEEAGVEDERRERMIKKIRPTVVSDEEIDSFLGKLKAKELEM